MPYSSETKIIHANNVDYLHTLSDTMARSEVSTVLDKMRSEQTPGGNMMSSNSVVSEYKENFRLSQPIPSFLFVGILFRVVEATNSLLTIRVNG